MECERRDEPGSSRGLGGNSRHSQGALPSLRSPKFRKGEAGGPEFARITPCLHPITLIPGKPSWERMTGTTPAPSRQFPNLSRASAFPALHPQTLQQFQPRGSNPSCSRCSAWSRNGLKLRIPRSSALLGVLLDPNFSSPGWPGKPSRAGIPSPWMLLALGAPREEPAQPHLPG